MQARFLRFFLLDMMCHCLMCAVKDLRCRTSYDNLAVAAVIQLDDNQVVHVCLHRTVIVTVAFIIIIFPSLIYALEVSSLPFDCSCKVTQCVLYVLLQYVTPVCINTDPQEHLTESYMTVI